MLWSSLGSWDLLFSLLNGHQVDRWSNVLKINVKFNHARQLPGDQMKPNVTLNKTGISYGVNIVGNFGDNLSKNKKQIYKNIEMLCRLSLKLHSVNCLIHTVC